MPRWKSKMLAVSLPSRSAGALAEVLDLLAAEAHGLAQTGEFRLGVVHGHVAFGDVELLGVEDHRRAMATPGETPMPFFIFMAERLCRPGRPLGPGRSGSSISPNPCSATSCLRRAAVDGLVGVVPVGDDLQHRALRGRQAHHGHDALGVHGQHAVGHFDLAAEPVGQFHELHGRTRVQPVLVHDGRLPVPRSPRYGLDGLSVGAGAVRRLGG